MTSDELKEALREHLHPREWALLFEVRNSTGYNGRRAADAVAMNLWPSAGLEIHGFELKVSRGDWLRELKQPDKATEIGRYCDRWWIVAAPDVVRRPELREGWGLLVPKTREVSAVGGGPNVVILELEVLQRAHLRVSQAPDRGFIASMLRAAAKASP